jgi:ligand-binding sensor domain-containing protein
MTFGDKILIFIKIIFGYGDLGSSRKIQGEDLYALQQRRGNYRLSNIAAMLRWLCLGGLMLGLVAASGWWALANNKAEDDDDLIILPGARDYTKPQERPKVKAEYDRGSQLARIYGPPKEWQSFRSTALITCAVRSERNLWAGTRGGGLIRWDLSSGGYQFYLPQVAQIQARTIQSLAAAPNGDLWIGTAGYGLGHLEQGRTQWKFFKKAQGIPDDNVQTLAWVNDDLWVGTRLGVARYRRGKWQAWTTRTGLPANDIRAIASDSSGRIWFSPNISTPFYWDGSRFSRTKQFPFVGSGCIVSDRKGGVWFCNEQGAVHLNQSGKAQVYVADHGLAESNVQSIYVDVGGGVWFGTLRRGLSYFKDGQWVTMNADHGLPGLNIRAILDEPGGKLLAVTHLSGVARYTDGRWQPLSSGIVGNQIKALEYSPDGAIWIGTSSGVSRFFRGYWYNLTTILPHHDVRAITFDPLGRAWIGTFGGGVVRYDGRAWQTFDVMSGMASSRVIGAGISPEGMWFAHELQGISQYDGNKWQIHNERSSSGVLPKAYPLSKLFVDSQFRIWAISEGGGVAVRPYRGRWRPLPNLRAGTQRGFVYDVTEDSTGGIWFGTREGLIRYKDQKFQQYTKNDGLPDNRVLAVTSEGNKIWIGTPKGVACFDGVSWRSFSRDSGLASEHVATIGITWWGTKWFGTAHDGLTIYRGE